MSIKLSRSKKAGARGRLVAIEPNRNFAQRVLLDELLGKMARPFDGFPFVIRIEERNRRQFAVIGDVGAQQPRRSALPELEDHRANRSGVVWNETPLRIAVVVVHPIIAEDRNERSRSTEIGVAAEMALEALHGSDRTGIRVRVGPVSLGEDDQGVDSTEAGADFRRGSVPLVVGP